MATARAKKVTGPTPQETATAAVAAYQQSESAYRSLVNQFEAMKTQLVTLRQKRDAERQEAMRLCAAASMAWRPNLSTEK